MPDIYTTNIGFGGADMKTAYITLSSIGRLVAMPVGGRGSSELRRVNSPSLPARPAATARNRRSSITSKNLLGYVVPAAARWAPSFRTRQEGGCSRSGVRQAGGFP